jgi:hypothetical protein
MRNADAPVVPCDAVVMTVCVGQSVKCASDRNGFALERWDRISLGDCFWSPVGFCEASPPSAAIRLQVMGRGMHESLLKR